MEFAGVPTDLLEYVYTMDPREGGIFQSKGAVFQSGESFSGADWKTHLVVGSEQRCTLDLQSYTDGETIAFQYIVILGELELLLSDQHTALAVTILAEKLFIIARNPDDIGGCFRGLLTLNNPEEDLIAFNDLSEFFIEVGRELETRHATARALSRNSATPPTTFTPPPAPPPSR